MRLNTYGSCAARRAQQERYRARYEVRKRLAAEATRQGAAHRAAMTPEERRSENVRRAIGNLGLIAGFLAFGLIMMLAFGTMAHPGPLG